MWSRTFKIPGEIKRKNKELDSQDSRRDEEQGGGAGLSSEPRRDQEQGDGAGLSYQDGLSCCRVVPQQLLLGHDVTLIRTAVKTAISEVHKLLGTGGVPTSLTLLFWRWLTVSSVFADWSAITSYTCPPLPPPLHPSPLPHPSHLSPSLISLMVSVGG